MTSPEPRRRVGLLGGTFDPPHLGHLVVAEVARVELGLDEVRFLVAGQPWMKDEFSPAEQRVTMTELAVEGNAAFVVDDREVQRAGVTYTVDTLEVLRQQDPDVEWLFLLGEDAAAFVPRWHRAEEALELATFVTVTRPGTQLDRREAPFDRMEHLDVPPIGISSTELRARVGRGVSIRYQVPDAVVGHIDQHGLYRSRGGTS